MQGTIAHPSHLIEGFIEGLASRRPALFNCYTSCQPEHGIADDRGAAQARLAVESRAYPLFRFDPSRGATLTECLDLSGNPAADADWPVYTLSYRKHERAHSLELPLTFADFAASEGRFRKHFRTVPEDAWHDDMLPLAEYLALPGGERDGKLPFIWHVLPDGRLGRLAVSAAIVASTEDRRDFWRLLRGLAPRAPAPQAELTETIRRDLVQQLAASLYQLAGGADALPDVEPGPSPEAAAGAGVMPKPQGNGGYLAPWIDTDACTACDECIRLNPNLFAYNEAGKAVIRDPAAGPYEDLVKAAERCTARVIHPGLPHDPNAPELVRWVERARKYN
jgi:pyruvate-ferredoxin/flavodoxin oxidoreductase